MQFERWFPVDMAKGQSHAYDLGTILCSGDENSARVGVEIKRNNTAETVTGTIKGYVVLPTGLALMPFDGAKDGNRAWIDLPEDALGMSGRISIAIRSFDTDETTVLLLASATVRRVDADQYYDPSDIVGDITDLIEDAEQAAQDAEAALAQATQIVSYAEQTGKTDAQKAQARTNIGAASTGDVSDVKSAVGISGLQYTVVSGKYIDNSSADKTSGNFDRSAPIQVPAQSTVVITAAGYNQGIAMIATCDENGNSIKAVTVSVDSTKRTYTYYTAVDTYVIVSYLKAQGCELSLLDSKSNDVLNRRMTPVETAVLSGYVPSFTTVSGKFINSAGVESSSANFTHSSVISVSAESYVTFKATGYLQGVAMIATCDQSGTTFVPVAVSVDSSEHTYTYFAEQDCYIVISYKTSAGHEIYIYGATANVSLLANINSIESALPLVSKNILSAFTSITCIGDSLTFGAVFTASNSYRQAYKPYPTVLGTKTGATVANLGETGATGASWWASHNSQIEEKTNQLTIIYLGTNSGLTDTMDTDMSGSDYTQWADTNTGDYGKIIAKSLACGSKVVLVKIYTSSGDADVTNAVIDKMAEKFSVAVVDNPYLSDKKYHYFPDASGINSTHYNDFGYAVFTDQLIYNLGNLPTDIMARIIPE